MDPVQQVLPAAEFDAFAAEYDAGDDNRLKRILGGADSFIDEKACWLLREMGRWPAASPEEKDLRLLDYGCGRGALMSALRRCGYRGFLAACDVSAQMLAEARRRWPEGPAPEFSLIERGESPFEDGTFDVVVVCSVLHHVEPMLRFLAYEDIARLLKPGGHVCVFEHNPYNPVTQWVVRHTSIDRNAVLLRPAEVRASLANAGITRAETHYLMFAPPKLKFCRMLDRVLSWLPLGAQYAVCATRE